MTDRTSDGLPLSYAGLLIDWQPWEHIDILCRIVQDCEGCGDRRPTRIARGIVPNPSKRRPDGRLIRFWAFRCPGCRETRVYDRVPEEGDDPMPMIEYQRPKIAMEVGPLPHPERSET